MKGEKEMPRGLMREKKYGLQIVINHFSFKKVPAKKTTEILVDVASCHATCGWLP